MEIKIGESARLAYLLFSKSAVHLRFSFMQETLSMHIDIGMKIFLQRVLESSACNMESVLAKRRSHCCRRGHNQFNFYVLLPFWFA